MPHNWEEIGMDLLEHGQQAYNQRDAGPGLLMETGGKYHGARLGHFDWSEHMIVPVTGNVAKNNQHNSEMTQVITTCFLADSH